MRTRRYMMVNLAQVILVALTTKGIHAATTSTEEITSTGYTMSSSQDDPTSSASNNDSSSTTPTTMEMTTSNLASSTVKPTTTSTTPPSDNTTIASSTASSTTSSTTSSTASSTASLTTSSPTSSTTSSTTPPPDSTTIASSTASSTPSSTVSSTTSSTTPSTASSSVAPTTSTPPPSSPATASQTSPTSTQAVPTKLVAIIVPIVVVVLAGLIILAMFMYFRRRSTSQRNPQSIEPGIILGETTGTEVKARNFADHVANLSADSAFGFADEFERLKAVGKHQPALASELPCNHPKNRFFNIIPYDHSRVKLLPTDDDEGSDYINANWIPGYFSRREFIATQGPLPHTRDNFWRMIWEYNCRCIIMLARCVEKHQAKCDHYWPVDEEPMFYGDIQVTIMKQITADAWVVTQLKMSKGMTERLINHYHYTIWPDMGVPAKKGSLIHFIRTIRSHIEPEGGPIVCHCSAGVGRTGTLITLDRVMNHLKEHDSVDVYDIVHELRSHRVLMVQTERQYIFVHECIRAVIQGNVYDDDEEEDTDEGKDNKGFTDDNGTKATV